MIGKRIVHCDHFYLIKDLFMSFVSLDQDSSPILMMAGVVYRSPLFVFRLTWAVLQRQFEKKQQ